MKPTPRHSSTRQRVVTVALALAAAFALGTPQLSSAANTTADAVIMNVATVTYTNTNTTPTSFTANASSKVTVNLVWAALNEPGYPKQDGTFSATACPGDTNSYDSGTTKSFLYALSATANGDDIYTLTKTLVSSTPSSNATLTMELLNHDGSLSTTIADDGSTTVTFGSAIPVGVKTATNDTLLFPGGTLAGFQQNDIVLVNTTTAGVRAFLVDTVTVGRAPVHENVGDTPQTTEGAFTFTEIQGELKLKAYGNVTITKNTTDFLVGPATDPDFDTDAPVAGEPVGELKLVHVAIYAEANTLGTDANVEFRLDTTNGETTNNENDIGPCNVGDWKGISLSITKQVRNLTDSGTFGATASGNPGDILEYQLTIDNTGGLAKSVVVTDDIPEYTTLVSFSDSYGGTEVFSPAAISTYFAQTNDGATTTLITTVNTDDQGNTSGDATGNAAGSTMTFYIGTGSTNAAGGTVDNDTNYTIKYQVKID